MSVSKQAKKDLFRPILWNSFQSNQTVECKNNFLVGETEVCWHTVLVLQHKNHVTCKGSRKSDCSHKFSIFKIDMYNRFFIILNIWHTSWYFMVSFCNVFFMSIQIWIFRFFSTQTPFYRWWRPKLTPEIKKYTVSPFWQP